MKSLIAKMNAMKFYKTTELVNDAEGFQEKLSKDITAPAFRKMVAEIQAKHFHSICRK